MVPDNVFGLPTHPLVVHLAVVLLPVAALAAIAWAVVPRWRARLRTPVIGLAVASAVVTWLTAEAGEKLRERLPRSQAIASHAELGDQMKVIAFGFMVVAVAGLLAEPVVRTRLSTSDGTRRLVAGGVATAVVAMSVIAVVWVVRTGDSGARAVWTGTASSSSTSH
ncbi:MAG: DUF2231 domain-containing protein [Mycobacteriales bacterium]